MIFQIFPLEIFQKLVNLLDFKDIIKLNLTCKRINVYELLQTIHVGTTIRHDSQIKLTRTDSLTSYVKITKYAIDFCQCLKKCKNVKKLKIGELYFMRNDIAVHNLFNVISRYENLRELTVMFKYNIKQNSIAILYNLLRFKSLDKLEKIKIPNIAIDHFPCSFFECGNLLANNVFINLQNIKYFNIYVKNKVHQYYLDKINHRTLKTLYITSKNSNIFNDYYTQYDDIQQTYIIKKTLLFPKLTKVNLKLEISDIKTFIYILEPITKQSIRKLVLDFKILGKNRKNLLGSLFEKINELPNLEVLKIKNLLPFNYIEPNMYTSRLSNKLKHVSIDFAKKTGRLYLKSSQIQDRIELIKVFSSLKEIGTLSINLHRYNCETQILKHLLSNIPHDMLPDGLKTLIIYDVNIFDYLSLFLEMSLNTSTLQYIIIDKISTFGRKHEKILDNTHAYDKFVKQCDLLKNQNKKLIINSIYVGNLLSKNLSEYNQKINKLLDCNIVYLQSNLRDFIRINNNCLTYAN